MKIKEVKDKMNEILVDNQGDSETQHLLEDELYVSILRHHASKGCKLSIEALKLEEAEYSRWYA